MKEAALNPPKVSPKPTAEEWKPIPAHLKAKHPKLTQQHLQPILAHPNQYAELEAGSDRTKEGPDSTFSNDDRAPPAP